MQIEQLVVGSMGVCCYIASCPVSKEAAVIDPGGNVDRILAAVRQAGLTVTAIIATHGHPDHVCGNRELKEATGAPIIMHQEEVAFLARPEISKYFSMLGLEASPPADRTVADGDQIAIGQQSFTVLHTPGHTPGGICLLSGDDLITGDTLFAGGVGRTDFPGGSWEQLMASIQNRLFTLPEEIRVWPGHGYGGCQSTIGTEKRSNPFF